MRYKINLKLNDDIKDDGQRHVIDLATGYILGNINAFNVIHGQANPMIDVEMSSIKFLMNNAKYDTSMIMNVDNEDYDLCELSIDRLFEHYFGITTDKYSYERLTN